MLTPLGKLVLRRERRLEDEARGRESSLGRNNGIKHMDTIGSDKT